MDSRSTRVWWAALAFGIAASWTSPAGADDESRRGPRRAAPDRSDASPHLRNPQNVVNPHDDDDRRGRRSAHRRGGDDNEGRGVRRRNSEDSPGEPFARRANGIAPGQRPPRGLCRIWIPGVPSGRQSAPGNCNALRTQLPAGAHLVRGR